MTKRGMAATVSHLAGRSDPSRILFPANSRLINITKQNSNIRICPARFVDTKTLSQQKEQ
jgi:hypothetical protein